MSRVKIPRGFPDAIQTCPQKQLGSGKVWGKGPLEICFTPTLWKMSLSYLNCYKTQECIPYYWHHCWKELLITFVLQSKARLKFETLPNSAFEFVTFSRSGKGVFMVKQVTFYYSTITKILFLFFDEWVFWFQIICGYHCLYFRWMIIAGLHALQKAFPFFPSYGLA